MANILLTKLRRKKKRSKTLYYIASKIDKRMVQFYVYGESSP